MLFTRNFVTIAINKFNKNTSVVLKYSTCPAATTTTQKENNKNINVKNYDDIPGPKPAPIFGFIWHTLPKVGRYYNLKQFELHKQLNKDYGDLVRLRDLKFSEDVVLCFNPKDIETVFRNEGPWPKRDILPSVKYYRETLRKDIFQGYGGVFCSDEKDWQDARSIQNSVLMKPQVVKQYASSMLDVANDFIAQIKYLSSKNDKNEMPDDFINELNKWAFESVGVLALDKRFGTLNTKLDKNSELQLFINDIHELFRGMYENDVLPSLSKYISTPAWRRYIATNDRITKFLLKHIEMTKAKIAEDAGKNGKEKQFSSMIENILQKHDDKYILSNAMDIILAGVDTTSRTQAGILVKLATHQQVQNKLRDEIISVFPDKDTPLTYDMLEKLPYLRAVIKEGLRLIPISLGTSRKTIKDLILSGYHVPKGTAILVEQLPLMHNEKYFKNADEFQPERWLRSENKGKNETLNPWSYLPFGFGHRSCVGRRIAQLEIEILTTQIIRNFKLDWNYGQVEYDMQLFYGISSPLKIQMTPI